jgi:hypothetical protein
MNFSREVENEEVEDEEEIVAEQEGDIHVVPSLPITEDVFVEQQMDVPPATAPIVPVPYPKVLRKLQTQSYVPIRPAPKRMKPKL